MQTNPPECKALCLGAGQSCCIIVKAADKWLTGVERSVGAAVVLLPLAEVHQYNCRTNGTPRSYLPVARKRRAGQGGTTIWHRT